MGYGRYGTSEVFVHFIRPNGAAKTHVYVQDVKLGTTRHDGASTRWTARDNSDWSCAQFDKYIYAANTVDGLWRLNITDTTSNAWEQADLKLSSLVVATSGVKLKTPDTQIVSWSSFTLFFSSGSVPYLEPSAPRVPASISINSSDQLEINYTGGGDAWGFTRYWFGGTFSSGQDWSKSRYLFANLLTERTSDIKPWEDPKIWPGKDAAYGEFKFYWSDNASATPGAPWTGWYEGKVSFSGSVPAEYPGSYFQGDIVVDLDYGITSGSVPITSVRRIFLGVPLDISNGGKVWCSRFSRGGTFLSRATVDDLVDVTGVPATSKDIEYAITFFNTTSSAESAATFKTLAASASAGLTKPGLPPLGATAQITLPAPGAGFNRTRLYRRRRSDGDKWYLLREATGAETQEDNRVDWSGDPLAWAELAIQPANYAFGTGVRADLKPQCIAVWKTHMALGVGPEVYLSEAQNPVDYAQPLRNTAAAGEVNTTATETSPRTLYVSNDQAENILQLVSTEHLYAGTTRGVYVMIGDNAAEATPFRKLPQARPPLNEGAMCAYENGVLCATKDGLFFYDASRSIAVDNNTQTETYEDLTVDIPESYKWLLAGSNSATPVIAGFAEGEIWVIKGSFFLKRTKTGRWEKGAFSTTSLSRNLAGVGSSSGGTEDDPDVPVFDNPGSGGGAGGDEPGEVSGTEVFGTNPAHWAIVVEQRHIYRTYKSGVQVEEVDTGWGAAGTSVSKTLTSSVSGSDALYTTPPTGVFKDFYNDSALRVVCEARARITIAYTGTDPLVTHAKIRVSGGILADVRGRVFNRYTGSFAGKGNVFRTIKHLEHVNPSESSTHTLGFDPASNANVTGFTSYFWSDILVPADGAQMVQTHYERDLARQIAIPRAGGTFEYATVADITGGYDTADFQTIYEGSPTTLELWQQAPEVYAGAGCGITFDDGSAFTRR
jgi:hypothetical protein